MKVNIKAVTAGKLTEDQKQVLRRVAMVLVEHGFSVKTEMKVKTSKLYTPKLKAV